MAYLEKDAKKRVQHKAVFTSFCVLLLVSMGLFSNVFGQLPDDSELDFCQMSIEELMNVQTTFSRKEESLFKSAASIIVISSEDIRRSGHQSIPEVLRMVPGLHVGKVDSNRWAITARGFNSLFAEKLLVMIDGRTVYTPLFSGVHWDVQDVMIEDIERIEVVKGPGGTLWGANAVNGIINIITKKASDTQGTLVSGGLGNEENGFSSIRYGGKMGEDAHYRVYAKYYNRDAAVFPGGDRASDYSEMLRQGFRVDWDCTEQDQLTVQGDIYTGYSGHRTTYTTPGANNTSDEHIDLFGMNVLGRWTRIFSDDSDMSLQFYYDRFDRDGLTHDEVRDTFDIDFQHRFQASDAHNIIWGFGYRFTGDDFDNSFMMSFNPEDRTDELYTAFIQDEITVIEDKVKFIVGTKVEKNDYTDFEFQPTARVLWTPNEKNTVWASFTRAVSTPSRFYSDVTMIFNTIPFNMQFSGNKDNKAQEVMAYELGYRVKPSDKLYFDVSLFYNEYDDLFATEYNPTPFSTTYLNRMFAETYGTEILSHWQVSDDWKLSVGYSFLEMQVHVSDASTNTTARTKEGRSPQHLFHVNSQMNLLENLEFDTTLYYVGPVKNYDIPEYLRFDAGITWHINKNMDFSIIGQNLLDDSHPEFDYANPTEAERSIFGKFTWRF